MKRVWISIPIGLATFVLMGSAALAHTSDETLKSIDFEQRLNAEIPPHLKFVDETGHEQNLHQLTSGKSTILVMSYFRCAHLCSLVLNGLAESLRDLDYKAGRDFNVAVVSIDPSDTAQVAAEKKRTYVSRYNNANPQGWNFLRGDPKSIQQLADTVGFRYRYDPKTKEYAHASGIMILTPSGKLSKYIFGINYPVQDLKFALMEASQGKIGTLADKVLLYCFNYDPQTGRYGFVIMRALKLLAVVTVIVIGTFLLVLFRNKGAEA